MPFYTFQVSRLNCWNDRSLHTQPQPQPYSMTLYEERRSARSDISVCYSLVCELKCNKVYISLQLVSHWTRWWYLFSCTTIFTKVRGTFTTPCVPFYSSPLSCTIAIYSVLQSKTEYKKPTSCYFRRVWSEQ